MLALALAGCGTGGDREQARAAAERFLGAFERHDTSSACGELSQAAVDALENQEGKDCPDALRALRLKPGKVTRVEVYVTSAKVDLASRETAFLDRGPSGWKLSAVGCAHDSKPADHPYSCQLEG
jgi:hypothetical protein